jgi:hypothetical protein
LGQAGGQGLVKETTSSEPKSKQTRKLAALQKNWRSFSNFSREKYLMIEIKDIKKFFHFVPYKQPFYGPNGNEN